MLLILKEIYSSMGISPDNQMPGVPGGSDDAGLNLSNSAYTSVDITTKNFPVG